MPLNIQRAQVPIEEKVGHITQAMLKLRTMSPGMGQISQANQLISQGKSDTACTGRRVALEILVPVALPAD